MNNLSKHKLGKFGENVPLSEFTDIKNLNDYKSNFPIFDLIGKKGIDIFVFSVKARKRHGNNGKLNSNYNILSGKNLSSKYKKSLDLFTEMGLDIYLIHYCFLIVPIQKKQECIWYWGEFIEIKSDCTLTNILEKRIKFFGIPTKDIDLKKYKIFGKCSWDNIINL